VAVVGNLPGSTASAPAPGVPARPTDGLRPTLAQVGALLGRGHRPPSPLPQFDATSRPTATQVLDLVNLVAGDVDAEFVGVAVTPVLAALATEAIAYAAASTIELTFFPDQTHDTSGIWWARYQQALTRIRTLLDLEGGGPGQVGGMVAQSQTLGAFVRAYGVQPSYGYDQVPSW